jgi:hypothetical protein
LAAFQGTGHYIGHLLIEKAFSAPKPKNEPSLRPWLQIFAPRDWQKIGNKTDLNR